MSDLKYVIRVFKDDKYLYSVHTDPDSVDNLIDYYKSQGNTCKIVCYTPTKGSNESEV